MFTVSLRQIALVLALLLLPVAALASSSIYGKVVKVADGDTLTILVDDRSQEKIRLAQIDAPERSQDFGRKAQQYLIDMAIHQTVRVDFEGRDRYGRIIGEVILPDGRNAGREMVRAGYAWQYVRYSKDRSLALLESEARTQQRGLWVDSSPMSPWEWRRKNNP